jgi:hypothetical protein
MPYDRSMSSHIRRKRGTPTVGVQVDIAPDVKHLIDKYMAAAGVPQWAVIEAAIRAGRPGPNGVPEGWEFPAPSGQPTLDVETEHGGAAIQRTA